MRLGRRASAPLILMAALAICAGAARAQSGRAWTDPPADLATPRTQPAPAVAPPASDPPKASPPAPPPVAPQAASPPAPKAPPEPVQASRPGAQERIQDPPQDPSRNRRGPTPQIPGANPEPSLEAEIPRDERPDGVDPALETARVEEARNLVVRYLASWSSPNRDAIEEATAFYGPYTVFHGRTMSRAQILKEKRRFARRWPERSYSPHPGSTNVDCEPYGRFCTVHIVVDFIAENPRRRQRSEGAAALMIAVSFDGGEPVIAAENSRVLRGAPQRGPVLEDTFDE